MRRDCRAGRLSSFYPLRWVELDGVARFDMDDLLLRFNDHVVDMARHDFAEYVLGDWGSRVQIPPLRPIKSKHYHQRNSVEFGWVATGSPRRANSALCRPASYLPQANVRHEPAVDPEDLSQTNCFGLSCWGGASGPNRDVGLTALRDLGELIVQCKQPRSARLIARMRADLPRGASATRSSETAPQPNAATRRRSPLSRNRRRNR